MFLCAIMEGIMGRQTGPIVVANAETSQKI